MPSVRHLRVFRFLERLTIFFFILCTLALAGFYSLGKLGVNELVAGLGILSLTLFVLFYIQSKFDSLLGVIIAQTDFAQNDAFTALYERSPAAYLTIRTDGKIIGCNPAAINLLEGESATINNLNFLKQIEEFSGEDASVFTGKIAAGMTVKDIEVKLKTILGKDVWVLLSVYKYRNEGERLISLVDVTEQKQVDTAKSEFVALATHQLRTPISAIRWNVELLEKNLGETKSEKQERYLIKIERNVMRMINLINDFLSVSKLEMGTFATSEENINLTDFFSSIVDEFTEKITEKQIVLNRLDNPPQLTIKADSRLFHIIVSNLVSNAVKYINNAGTLTFTYELKGDRLEIIVADDGIGIPEAELSKLFNKFYRASNAQAHQTEGTGLGLYIVKQSVEQLGGTISVESAENQGAKFIVNIPARVV